MLKIPGTPGSDNSPSDSLFPRNEQMDSDDTFSKLVDSDRKNAGQQSREMTSHFSRFGSEKRHVAQESPFAQFLRGIKLALVKLFGGGLGIKPPMIQPMYGAVVNPEPPAVQPLYGAVVPPEPPVAQPLYGAVVPSEPPVAQPMYGAVMPPDMDNKPHGNS